jgi:hypothetical protein
MFAVKIIIVNIEKNNNAVHDSNFLDSIANSSLVLKISKNLVASNSPKNIAAKALDTSSLN